MAVWQLDDELWFPDPRWGEDDGLVAVGGDLSVERLVLAYSNGFFPWYAYQMESEPHWYCPLERYVIFPNDKLQAIGSDDQLTKFRDALENEVLGKAVQRPKAEMRRVGRGLVLTSSRRSPVCIIVAMLPALKSGNQRTMPQKDILLADSMASHFAMPFSARVCSRSFPMPRNWP